MDIGLRDAGWYQALTLTERIALPKAPRGTPPRFDPDIALKRLNHWSREPEFKDNEPLFDERLSREGISRDDLLVLLGQNAEDIRNQCESIPDWLLDLEFYLSSTKSSSSQEPLEDIPGLSDPSGSGQSGFAFLGLLRPAILTARRRLQRAVEELVDGDRSLDIDSTHLVDMLLPNLGFQLMLIIKRTMVLELNVARLQDLLAGETPEERFASFITRITDPDIALSIFKEYPVMARQSVIALNNWVNVSLEFCGRLRGDLLSIRDYFNRGAELGPVVELTVGAGDNHRQGRSVCILTFGSGLKLVYKPRPLSVDVHFQELLAWANRHDADPEFLEVKVLDRGSYGWIEFVEAAPCRSKDEISRFYSRQGGYLALLYVLRATDFHFENLIACGEHPVLIDLESLFHRSALESQSGDATSAGAQAIDDSVLRTGLLPFKLFTGANQQDGIDMSGLGGAAGQLTPGPVSSWEDAGTDTMRFARKRLEMPGGNNRPSLNGIEVNAFDYTREIVSGFTSMYRLLERHRDDLVSANGPLERFAGDEVRCVLRPTWSYARLLLESFHPNLLRNALNRDCLFDQLWRQVESRPVLKGVIEFEREDLQNGDIPMFTTRTDSHDISSSFGQVIADVLEQPGLELARERIRRLGADDLSRQVWFIRSAMTALALESAEDYRPVSPIARKESKAKATRDRLMSAACAVADRLQTLALDGAHGEISWIGLGLVGERHWTLATAGLDLYSGLSGIGLFFGYMGKITGQERYTRTARTVARIVIRALNAAKWPPDLPIGAFGTLAGSAYFLTHMASLWSDTDLLTEAEKVLGVVQPAVGNDTHLDIMFGAAGCIPVLLGLNSIRPRNTLVDAALDCGDHLISRAEPAGPGIAWKTAPNSRGPLAGFSHGVAGIAWALFELHAMTSEVRFRDAAFEGLAYERSLFSVEASNWPDLRVFDGLPAAGTRRPDFMTAWCHGAAGIGIARVGMLRHSPEPDIAAEVEREVNAAVKATIAQGFSSNHCLCHGALGNIELLLAASEALADPGIGLEAYRAAAVVLDSESKTGWLCGVPAGVETPGLMVGLAGIGYEFLRLAAPETVPSVLALSSPIV